MTQFAISHQIIKAAQTAANENKSPALDAKASADAAKAAAESVKVE